MIDLRAFAFIDQLQKQLVGYIGTAARGYYPIAGQAALFMEIAPGIEINTITDIVMKKANVRPGAMVVERTYGMLQVHSDSPADVKMAGEVALDYLGMKEKDRLKPKILATETIDFVLNPEAKRRLLFRRRSALRINGPLMEPAVTKLPLTEAVKLYGKILMPYVFLPARGLGYLRSLLVNDKDTAPCIFE